MDLKIFTENVEEKAREQIDALATHPAFKDSKVRIMPDVHAGAGCVIGFTCPVSDKIVPNIIGLDIGCGVRVCKLGKIDIDLAAFDAYVKEHIPAGMSVNQTDTCSVDRLKDNLLCFPYLKNVSWLTKSIGTLGGGNHFIEIDEDDEGCKYLVIHTGSRNVGKQVAEYYQDLAVRRCESENVPELIKLAVETLKKMGREKDIQTTIAKIKRDAANSRLPEALCYLQGKDLEDYIHDMRFCQEFAVSNRSAIWFRLGPSYLRRVCPDFDFYSHECFESVHNYISDDGMIRKGAISAYAGERVIIPLNMRDGSIIGIGKGNPDWNKSAPHGAGRLMSRSAARKELSLEDFRKAMGGIYTTTADMTTIDEAPMAYKNAGEILSAIGDTVEVEKVIKPIYNFKASEDGPAWTEGKK